MRTVTIDGKEYASDDLRKLADEIEQEPKRFVPDAGTEHAFVMDEFCVSTTTLQNRLRIAAGNCYPTEELTERAIAMKAEASKQIHAALMVDPNARLGCIGTVLNKENELATKQMAKILEDWK